MSEPTTRPRYRVGQVVRITHAWAERMPPRPIGDVMWDECWGCYTYSLPLCLIRIEEHMLEATDEPDISPAEWVESVWPKIRP